MLHDDVVIWRRFPHYWAFCEGNHRWMVDDDPEVRSFNVFLDIGLNKLLNKVSICRRSRCHVRCLCDVNITSKYNINSWFQTICLLAETLTLSHRQTDRLTDSFAHRNSRDLAHSLTKPTVMLASWRSPRAAAIRHWNEVVPSESITHELLPQTSSSASMSIEWLFAVIFPEVNTIILTKFIACHHVDLFNDCNYLVPECQVIICLRTDI